MKKIFAIMAMAAAVLTGCHHGAAEHDHEGEEQAHSHSSVQLAAYSSGIELYAESEEIEEGEYAELTAYFTNMDTFKAAEGKEAELSYLAAGGGTETVQGEYVRPGVFRFHFVPGADKDVLRNISFAGTDFSCAGASHEHFPDANVIKFTKEQSWKVDFGYEQVRRENIGEVIGTVGRISSLQTEERTVTARTAGVVSFARSGGLLPGQAVHAGEALFLISTEGMSDSNLEVRFMTVKAEYERADEEYRRKSILAEDNIVSKAELAGAKAAWLAAEAEYRNLEKYFINGSFSAISEIDGFIDEVYVANGDYVEAGQRLACVSRDKRLLVTAKVQSGHVPALRNITKVVFSKNGYGNMTLEDMKGRLLAVGRSTESGSALIPVTFEIENLFDAVPGSFTDMYISTGSSVSNLTVADGAIVEESGNYFVYKQLSPVMFEKIQVRTGASDGQRTVVLSGIEDGDTVVSEGAAILKLAQAAGTLDAHSGHVH